VTGRLERRAEEWAASFHNRRHLVRARDWLVVLDPAADEELRLAALLHDAERNFPGGPVYDPGTMAPDEERYLRAHAARSAEIVGGWLAEQGGRGETVDEVRRLILAHEWGGDERQDLVQAADSLSFLEVNAELVHGWVEDARCTRERGREQLRHMRDRIRLERARPVADALYEEAAARV